MGFAYATTVQGKIIIIIEVIIIIIITPEDVDLHRQWLLEARRQQWWLTDK